MSSINKIKVGGIVYTIADGTEPLIAPVQDSLVALKTYAVGEQFIYNGNLYKATAPIASGGTITINGNCALADSIADQVTELNNELSVKTREWSSVVVAANGMGYVSDSTLKNKLIIGVRAVNASSQAVMIQSYFSDDTQMAVVFRNTSASANTIEKVIVFYIG